LRPAGRPRRRSARACRIHIGQRRRRGTPAARDPARPPAASPSTVTTVAAGRLRCRDQAGASRQAVQQHGARAALALLAGVLAAGQAESLAQREQQALARPDVVGRPGLAVDGEGPLSWLGPGPGQGSPGQHGERVVAVRRGAPHIVDGRRRGRDQLAEAPDQVGVEVAPVPGQFGRERLGRRGPARRRAAEPIPVPTVLCVRSRATATAQTAITIALRVPTLANC
jgi:hypothetical protein